MVRVRPHPFDVAAVSGGASQAQPDHVHEQTRDPQQVHGISDECRGNDVVNKERSIIRQEDAPERDAAPPLEHNVLLLSDQSNFIKTSLSRDFLNFTLADNMQPKCENRNWQYNLNVNYNVMVWKLKICLWSLI